MLIMLIISYIKLDKTCKSCQKDTFLGLFSKVAEYANRKVMFLHTCKLFLFSPENYVICSFEKANVSSYGQNKDVVRIKY